MIPPNLSKATIADEENFIVLDAQATTLSLMQLLPFVPSSHVGPRQSGTGWSYFLENIGQQFAESGDRGAWERI